MTGKESDTHLTCQRCGASRPRALGNFARLDNEDPSKGYVCYAGGCGHEYPMGDRTVCTHCISCGHPFFREDVWSDVEESTREGGTGVVHARVTAEDGLCIQCATRGATRALVAILHRMLARERE